MLTISIGVTHHSTTHFPRLFSLSPTFPRPLSNSLTFPGIPGWWPPCLECKHTHLAVKWRVHYQLVSDLCWRRQLVSGLYWRRRQRPVSAGECGKYHVPTSRQCLLAEQWTWRFAGQYLVSGSHDLTATCTQMSQIQSSNASMSIHGHSYKQTLVIQMPLKFGENCEIP